MKAQSGALLSKSLVGVSLIFRSILDHSNKNSDNEKSKKVDFRFAYSSVKNYDSLENLNLMPFIISISEKFSDRIHHDVWVFNEHGIESHGFSRVSFDKNSSLIPLEYDEIGKEDCKKLDYYQEVIKKMIFHVEEKGLLAPHSIIKRHPMYENLKNSKTDSNHQFVGNVRSLKYEEVSLFGDVVLARYDKWQKFNGFSCDLELLIAQNFLDEERDILLPEILPLKIVLREKLEDKICLDSYLLSPKRFRISHEYYVKEINGREYRGRDRTFLKLNEYKNPISVMLQSNGKLPFQIENHPDIQDLKK